MCWFHMKCKVTDRLSVINDVNIRNEVIQDIQVLHNAPSEVLFDTAVELFFEKWRAQNDAQINEYLDYLHSEWIVGHKGWFLGYIHGPTSNNGLESNNKLIKKHHTLRKQLPMGEFLQIILEIVLRWSKERQPGNLLCKKSYIVEKELNNDDFSF